MLLLLQMCRITMFDDKPDQSQLDIPLLFLPCNHFSSMLNASIQNTDTKYSHNINIINQGFQTGKSKKIRWFTYAGVSSSCKRAVCRDRGRLQITEEQNMS